MDDIYESYRYFVNKDDFAYIVLDEIQKVDKWERWVRSVLERKEKVKLIVTGSGSRILTPKLASILTGRKLTYNLFPLSLRGFLKFKGLDKNYFSRKERELLLREYIEFGAFPLVVLTEIKGQKTYFLQEVYDDIVTKDIMSKYSLREENVLRKAAYLVMNSFSKYVSVGRVRNSLKSIMKLNVSPSTLNNYIDYFDKSSLFIFVPIFSYNIKDQMQYPRKVYCIDSGMINSIILRFSEKVGRLYENVIAVELRRRGEEIYYWKNPRHEEVDFVVKEGLRVRELIQVCYDLRDKKVKDREIGTLVKAGKELKCRNLLLISPNKSGEEKIDGRRIKYVRLWDWLLGG